MSGSVVDSGRSVGDSVGRSPIVVVVVVVVVDSGTPLLATPTESPYRVYKSPYTGKVRLQALP
jgi:hypothetical protein